MCIEVYELGFHPFLQLENIPAISTGEEKRKEIHGLSGKFPNIQNSPPLRRPSGAQQVLLSSNEFDELRCKIRIALILLNH